MKKLTHLFFIAFCLWSSNLFAQQTAPKDVDKIVSSLNVYMTVRPQEKIHIHFDKPFYSVGDTVWFKVYVANALGHRLSSISKVVYLDIQKPGGGTNHLVLPVNAGMASAQLVLSDSLYREGNYPLRAYTQLMRNNSEDYFFNYTLHVGDVLNQKTSVSASFSQNPQGLIAEVKYTNIKGTPISNQDVSYKLKQGDKILFAGKIKTDFSGKTGTIFPKDKLPTDGKLILETNSLLLSGAVMNNRFVVNTNKNKLSLDFFPEGGSLVAGLRSKVAFKATGNDGLGIAVKGTIEDEKGMQVAIFETAHAGMGVFALMPKAGDDYTAVLEDGQRFKLPSALNDGFVMAVNQTTTNELMVAISRSAGIEVNKEVRLVVQANGEVQQALNLPMKGNSITFNIPNDQLAEGINQFTLFSAANEPLAERLVFVKKQQVETKLESDKPEYAPRDLVKLDFDNGANMVGGYSVAVVKADKITLPDEKQLSIYASLLLSSDLRGNIEDPNYYFTNPNSQTESELDALMLSQGWRRFSWSEVLAGNAKPPKYLAEQGLSITGKINTLVGGKPVANAKIKLLASKELVFLDTVSNAQGKFTFRDLQLGDSVEVILRASGEKDSRNVKIVLDEMDALKEFDGKDEIPALELGTDTAMKSYLAQTANLFDEMEKTGKIRQGTTLKTVEIVTRKKAPEIKGSIYPFAAAPPDYTLAPDKLQEMNSLESNLWGINGILVKQQQIWGRNPTTKNKVGPMAILLNGTAIEDLSGINPRSLTGVQIIKGGVIASNMAASLMLPDGATTYGIVFLTMKGIPDKFIKPTRPPGFLQKTFAGYTYAREFYVPNYEVKTDGPKNDFRSTLFWKPDIITDEEGKAIFSFYASDEPGKYRVTVEGIGANGQLCRKISYFTVN